MAEQQTPGVGQCMVGQPGNRCPDLAVGVIAVSSIPDVWHLEVEPTPGVVLLCDRHFNTPPSNWN